MRFGFGLVGILLVVGIIVYYMKEVAHPADTVRQGESVKEDVRQLAGQDKSGMKASESITMQEQSRNGKLEGIVVQDLIAEGPMEAYYGLQLDDVIVAAGQMRFRDLNNDAEMAKALVLEAYQKQQPLEVIRAGQTIVLPAGGGTAVGGEEQNPLQRQLDAIQQGATRQ